MAQRRYRVEVWNQTNTQRLGIFTQLLELQRSRVLKGEETIKFSAPLDDAASAVLTQGNVLRLQWPGQAADFTLWRLAEDARIRTEEDVTQLNVEAYALWMDFRHGIVRQTLAGGRSLASFGLVGVPPEQILSDFVLPSYAGSAIAFELGVVEPGVAAAIDIAFERTSPLAALRMIEEAAQCEAFFRLNVAGTAYEIDLLEHVGRQAGGAELRYRKNLKGLERVREERDVATRLYAYGNGLLTLADAEWDVAAAPGGVISFAGQHPVFEDGAFVGLYFFVPRLAHAANPELDAYPITASSAAGTITVDTTGKDPIVAGEFGWIAVDDEGRRLDYLESPGGVSEYGVRVDALLADDVPDASNLLLNGDFSEWAGGMPSSWAKEGAPVVTESQEARYIQQGARAAHVTASAAEEGLISDPFDVAAEDSRPYTGLMAGLTIVSGRVRMELRHSNGKTYPIQERPQNEGMDVYITLSAGPAHPEPLPAGTAQLAIVAHGAAAEWYLDCAMVTPQIASDVPDFVRRNGAWALWDKTAAELADRTRPRVEYRISIVDLHKIDRDVFRFDELELGDDVKVRDPIAQETQRIIEITEDLLNVSTTEVVVAPSVRERIVDPYRPKLPSLAGTIGRGGFRGPAHNGPAIIDHDAQYDRITGQLFVQFIANARTATVQLYTKLSYGGAYPGAPAASVADRTGVFPGISVGETEPLYYKLVALDGRGVPGEPVEGAFNASPEPADGSVTPDDYRPDPALRCEYDSGVTKIVVTIPGGKTKTFLGLSGPGNLTYVVGMLLDDMTAEALFTANLTKGPYIVDYFSGATSRRMFHGDLHGPSGANAPTADVRAMRVEGNVTKARILYAGSLGVGAAGPLEWRRRIDREDTGQGVWGPGGGDGWVNGSSGAFALSYEETIDRRRLWGTEVYFQTRDADGRVSRIDHVNVEGEFMREPKDGAIRLLREADDIEGMPGVEGFRSTARKGRDATGAVVTWDPLVRRHLDGTLDLTMLDHGGREVRRLWAKALSADPDTTDAFGSSQGSSYLITTANEKTGGGRGFGGFTNASGGLASTASHFGGIEVRRMFAKALAADPDTTDALGSVQGSVYRITTTDEKTGGARGFGGFTNASGGLAASATHSGGIEVRRLFAKALHGDPDTTDAFGALQGITYQITTVNERTGGARGFGGFKNASGGLVATSTVEEDGFDRSVENRYRSQLRANGAAGFGQRVRGEIDELEGNPGIEGSRAISRTGKDATGAATTWDPLARRHYQGTLDLSIVDHGSRAVNRMFAKALSADPDTTDAFGSAQGSSYQITTVVERVGGGRAANALDGSSRLQPLYSPQVLAGNIGGVQYGWTGNLLTAEPNKITVAAHSVQYGWGDVPYSSNSITGLSASTKYHVYVDDPGYVGGSVTYEATPSARDVLDGAGRYYVGTITTPAAGSSGGGGGGAGCVAATSYVRRDLCARDVARGAYLDILVGDRVTEHPVQLVWDPVVRPCVRLVSESGAALVVSRDTQVTLRNGRSVAACNLAGELVAVLCGGAVRWEAVTVEEVGDAEVSRLSLGGATFAAGEDPDARIFTHNADVIK